MLKYSNIFLFQNYLTFIYIQIFLIFIWGLLALIWFQNMAFQSRFAEDNSSLNYRNSGILSYLNLIQLLWGLQFLRDSCNFLSILSLLLCFRKCRRLVLERIMLNIFIIYETLIQALGKCRWRLFPQRFLLNSSLICRTFHLSSRDLLQQIRHDMHKLM